MAFSFGGAPTPAPSGGGFSFGSSSNTPAPSFGFGTSSSSTTTFGSSPAPATAFGTSPAPATAFGSAPAPTGLFGSSPATTFGSTPAPAFGAAPSGGFGSGGGLFGTPSAAPAPFGSLQPAAQQPTPQIKGSTLYTDLSPQYKAVIDKIYNSMMEHKRTLLQVQSTGPAALQVPSSHNAEATMQETPKSQLQLQVEQVTKELNRLQQELAQTNEYAVKQKSTAEENAAAAYTFAKWPLEANAVRHGISLSTTSASANEEKKDGENPHTNANQNEETDISIRLGELLDQATLHVDRIERMPSPYFWQCLDDFQRRILDLQDQLLLARHQIEHSRTRPSGSAIHVAVVVEEQHRAIWSMGDRLARLNSAVNEIRHKYKLYERPGQNVLEKAKKEEIDRHQRVNERLRRAYLQSAQTPVPVATSSSTAPAPATSSFGFSSTAPAPSAFFASTTTTAPAPSTSSTSAFSFSGSTPAPAVSGPSPAPALFGGATSSSFVASNATAPASSGLGFTSPAGITPTTPKKKSTSASRRLNRR